MHSAIGQDDVWGTISAQPNVKRSQHLAERTVVYAMRCNDNRLARQPLGRHKGFDLLLRPESGLTGGQRRSLPVPAQNSASARSLHQCVEDLCRGHLAAKLLANVVRSSAVEKRRQQLIRPAAKKKMPSIGHQYDAFAGHDFDLEMRTELRTVQHRTTPFSQSRLVVIPKQRSQRKREFAPFVSYELRKSALVPECA